MYAIRSYYGFLEDEPVVAGPPSTAYRCRKFLARNRVGVTAGLIVLLALGPVFVVMALFGGTRGLTAGWLRGVALTALTTPLSTTKKIRCQPPASARKP